MKWIRVKLDIKRVPPKVALSGALLMKEEFYLMNPSEPIINWNVLLTNHSQLGT